MIEPYTAVGLIPTFWGATRREDIRKNLEHLRHVAKAAVLLSNLDIPVRLVAVPEGALQGFNDEVLDIDHVEYAKNCAIDTWA
jgi:beta-ureidopropionase